MGVVGLRWKEIPFPKLTVGTRGKQTLGEIAKAKDRNWAFRTVKWEEFVALVTECHCHMEKILLRTRSNVQR